MPPSEVQTDRDAENTLRFNEGYREILFVYDLCFGAFSLLMTVLALVAALQERTSFRTVWFLGSFVAGNLLLSQVSNRVNNRFRLELFRIFIFNGALAFSAFIFSDGIFSNYWPCYLVMSLAGGNFFTTQLRKKSTAYLQCVFWLVNLAIANFVLVKVPWGVIHFTIISAVIAMSTSILIEMAHLFNRSLEKEKEMKAQLLHSSKMTALGEMAGGMAHEINNPLAIIHANANLITEMVSEPDPDVRVLGQLTQTIEDTATRIAAIVSGLRSFARDGSRDQLRTTAVQSVVDDTLSLCYQRIEGAGIRIETSVPKDLMIDCRAVQISQVLLNLLINAYDAVRSTAIADKWIRIEAQARGQDVQISVTDCGPGIPREIYDKIMQPFYTTKPVGSGTGLGLSVSQGLITAHFGRLFVDTQSQNTRFVIQLPMARR